MKLQNYIRVLGFLGVAVCVATSTVSAKMYKPSTDTHVERVLSQSKLAIVLFYTNGASSKTDTQMRERIRKLKDNFRAASHEEPMVSFMRVNIAHAKLTHTMHTYHVTSREPMYMLFYHGNPFKNKNGEIVAKSGYLSQDDVVDLIEDNFAHYIDAQLLRERKREERRRVAWDTGWYAGGYGPYYNGYEYSNYWWGNGYFPSW